MVGPVLKFAADAVVCVAGAATAAMLDGVPVTPGVPTAVVSGSVLDMGKLAGPGMRGYLAVAGGIDVPSVLGSRSTFVLGKFGGLSGRALKRGDRLLLGTSGGARQDVSARLPVLSSSWELRVMLGPHGAPAHLSPEGADELFAADWAVDHRSDRTGVRLVGPTPGWARTDGGEAGLHPSNVHDSAYPVGGIMLSGDTPVIVGPDGPQPRRLCRAVCGDRRRPLDPRAAPTRGFGSPGAGDARAGRDRSGRPACTSSGCVLRRPVTSRSALVGMDQLPRHGSTRSHLGLK